MVVVQLYDGDTETKLCESWKFDTQETQNAHGILQLPIYKTEKQTYFFIKMLFIDPPNLTENRNACMLNFKQ